MEQYGAMISVVRARRELQRGSRTPIEAVGRFTVDDPNQFRSLATIMLGGAALGGMSGVTGKAVEMSLDLVFGPWRPRPDLPHRVLLVVTPEALTAFGSDHRDPLGPRAAKWDAGTFGVHVDRLPFEIDVMIEWDHNRLQLSGRRGWRSGAATTVQAIRELADSNRSW